jgi:hypothetical protein
MGSHNGHNGNGNCNSTTQDRGEPTEQDLAIFERRLANHSVYAIAKEFQIAVKEVDAALDRACAPLDEEFRLRTVHLELERFDRLCRVFYEQALAGDHAAAIVVMRVSERRAAILGLDVPSASRRDPVMLQVQQSPQPTSTDRIKAALDRIAAEGKIRKPEEPGEPEEPA